MLLQIRGKLTDGDAIHLNHDTILNTMREVVQSNHRLTDPVHNLSITNFIIVNPYLIGYQVQVICAADQDFDDFSQGKCGDARGALFNIIPVDSLNFEFNFTDTDRQVLLSHSSYIVMEKSWGLR